MGFEKMKHIIYACYCVYDNNDFLRASLCVIQEFVDHIIIVDGRYHDYPETPGYVLDNFKNYPFAGVGDGFEGTVWSNQVEKRNAYVNAVPNSTDEVSNWMLIIDGDEIPFGDALHEIRDYVDKRPSDILFGIPLVNPDKLTWIPRLIKKMEGMQYVDFHHNLQYKGVNLLGPSKFKIPMLPPRIINLMHMKTFRPDWTKQAKQMYMASPEKAREKEIIDQRQIDAIFNERVKDTINRNVAN